MRGQLRHAQNISVEGARYMCILDTQMINGYFLELSCQLLCAVGPVPVVALAHLYKTACCLAEVHPYSDTSKFTKTDDTRNTLG